MPVLKPLSECRLYRPHLFLEKKHPVDKTRDANSIPNKIRRMFMGLPPGVLPPCQRHVLTAQFPCGLSLIMPAYQAAIKSCSETSAILDEPDNAELARSV